MEEERYVQKTRRAALVSSQSYTIFSSRLLIGCSTRIRCMRRGRLLSRWLRSAQLSFAQFLHPGSDLQERRLHIVVAGRHHIKSRVSGRRFPVELGIKRHSKGFQGSGASDPLRGWTEFVGNTAGEHIISLVRENLRTDEIQPRSGRGLGLHSTFRRER